MKDYRIPLSLALPAAIGLLGLLWLLRRKSGSDKGKTASKDVLKEDKHLSKWNDKAQLEQRTPHIEKEGITISQRKIPENQARDRGSSDLEIKELTDFLDTARNQVSTSSDHLDVESKLGFDVEQSQCKAQASVTQCGQGDGLAPSQIVHIEPPMTTTMGDCLQEVHMDQPNERSHSQPVNQMSFDSGTSNQLPSEGQSLGSQAVEETLTHKTGSSKIQATFVDSDHLQNFTDLKSKRSSSSSDTQTLHTENVQLNIHAEHFVNYNTYSATPKPSVCDKTVESFENNSRTIGAAVLMCDNLGIVTSLQQATPVSSLLTTTSVLPSSDYSSSFSDAETHSHICPSQNFEKIDHIEESWNTSDSEFASELHDQLTLSTSVMTAGGTLSSNKIDTVISNSRLPCDWDGARSLASPWMPTTTSSGIDILGSEDVDSIWDTESFIDANLNSSVSLVNTFSILAPCDADSSLNPIPSSCDLNSKQETLPATTWFSGSLIDATDISRSESEHRVDDAAVALSSKSTKDESPAKSSSPACDSNSEGSNDSGRGGSEHDVAYQACETLVHFEFNIPSDLCGRFIGKHGKNINYLKTKTGAHLSLANNMYTPDYQICQVVGSQTEVDDALASIRRKFPLRDYPLLTMTPIDMSPAPVVLQPEHQLIIPDVMQLSLPEGVSVDVFVSAIVDAGHLFVQQPTHRSFMSLEKLNYFLGLVYAQDPNVPCVPAPVESGIICVCENDGFWYRAMIMTSEDENGECQVKFVDYGGYAMMTVSSLKQIRADFMTLPFQAVECFMANVTPNQNEQFFSEEATLALSDMTRDKLLQCQVVARIENGIPYIHLYQISTESNSAVMINRALVNSRLVRWIEIL